MIIHKATDEELIQLILDFADDQPHFEPSFALNMQTRIRDYGSLTPPQRDALERIVRRWRMVEWQEEYLPVTRPNEARVH